MKFLICFGFILHLLFLISIFYIYFRSPVLTDLTPQQELIDPPAKRLILFIADGLRVESIEGNLEKVPFLRGIMQSRGMSGTSHTRVPTESRPGHVALIAGLYEDPSAIFKGWQDNPVDFDHTFNRTRMTWGWGSPDIVPIFSRTVKDGHVVSETYDPKDEDFSGQSETKLLDLWVFQRVKEFLKDQGKVEYLQKNNQVVLFLHLLGMDTAGHVHKPNSAKFFENLVAVDEGIKEIYEKIEETFPDGKTAYIFTSDHGMTDRGSHGDGHHFETETPFTAWGAGIRDWPEIKTFPHNQLYTELAAKLMPRFDLEQADIAPLMSSLLGIPVAVNNFGRLPFLYLNASTKYIAEALNNNAQQILQQCKKLYDQTKQKRFKLFVSDEEYSVEYRVLKMEYLLNKAFKAGEYENVPELSNTLMNEAIDAIDFYQQYYKRELLLTLTITMGGWVYLLIQQLYLKTQRLRQRTSSRQKIVIIVTIISILGIILFNYVQNTPAMVTFYFILPTITWFFVYFRRNHAKFPTMSKCMVSIAILTLLVNTELMIIAFFHRHILSVILIGHCIYELSLGPKFNWKLLVSTLFLAVFPSLPVVQKDSKENVILYVGIFLWCMKTVKNFLSTPSKFSFWQLTLTILASTNLVYIIYCLDNGLGVPVLNQIGCWWISIGALLTPMLAPLSLKHRIEAIENALIIPYMLMSLSYEPLFLLALVLNVRYWIESELLLHQDMETTASLTFEVEHNYETRLVNLGDVRRVTKFVLYLLISLFGTGSIASISSFDPNWVRCFVSTFSPFLMAGLIIVKLTMPLLYLACCLKALNVITKIQVQKLFIMILMICDIMCLNFLFLVKNRGSWLDIGTSISHFIIMESTVLVISILYGIGIALTTFGLNRTNSRLPLISAAKISQD